MIKQHIVTECYTQQHATLEMMGLRSTFESISEVYFSNSFGKKFQNGLWGISNLEVIWDL